MARRLSNPDPLATVAEMRWLVVRDVCSRPLRHSVLPPNSDLRAALAAEQKRLVDEGWNSEELTRYSFVYCQRGNERVCVSIECFEPGTAPIGHGSMIGRKR